LDATIYHNANCGTSRTVLDLLRSAGAEVRVVDYLADPPSAAELARLYAAAGLTPAQGLRAPRACRGRARRGIRRRDPRRDGMKAVSIRVL
jgi:arsenate reductase